MKHEITSDSPSYIIDELENNEHQPQEAPFVVKLFVGIIIVGECAIKKAIKDVNSEALVYELITSTLIDHEEYSHDFYGSEEFDSDKAISATSDHEKVIRTITLTKA